MKTFISAVLVGAALTVAGPAAADPVSKADRTNAARACASLRSTMGAQTFAQTYGATSARTAYGRCVAQMRREAHAARHEARATCAKATNAKGKGKGRSKAQAACAAKQARTALKQEVDATKNAAHACKAERDDMGSQAFRDKYGTNTNKRNAFGKCVSAKAKQNGGGDDEDDDAEAGRRLRATLTGTAGSGTFTATINLGKQQLCYTLTATGLTDVTAAHIHVKPNPPGTVVVPLAAPTSGSSSGCVTVARTLLQQILANPSNYYVNVHTTALPAGAISGDLTR